jgi:4,5-DOPA dioxygenase extradiol
MQTQDPQAAAAKPSATPRMPSIFVGHGSPMNAIADNAYTRTLRAWGAGLGRPRAIAVVSAHWLTEGGIRVASTPTPATIHDFGGFPRQLYEQRYPAPGAPTWAERAAALLGAHFPTALDPGYGLDHGAWGVLAHLYPAADVPTFQVSIDITAPGADQLAAGRLLGALRDEGVLILASGNVTHNLRAVHWQAEATPRGLERWADEFDQAVRAALERGDDAALADYRRLTPEAALAVPFADHYDPLLVARGAAGAHEPVRQVIEGFQHGTISMRSVQWG